MLTLGRFLLWLSLAAALAFECAGFMLAGLWIAVGLAVIPTLLLALSIRKGAGWQGTAGLMGAVGLSAAGLLLHAPVACMIAGSAAALAGWDLANFDRSLRGNPDGKDHDRLERKHVQYLVAALGIGLALAVVGRGISIQLPFLIFILVIAVNFFSLDRIARVSKNKHGRSR